MEKKEKDTSGFERARSVRATRSEGGADLPSPGCHSPGQPGASA